MNNGMKIAISQIKSISNYDIVIKNHIANIIRDNDILFRSLANLLEQKGSVTYSFMVLA